MILPGINNASGLSSDDKKELEALLNVSASVENRNIRLKQYYDTDAIAPSIGIETIPPSVDLKEVCDWPKKAVTSVSERSRFDGFVFDSDLKDEALMKAVRDNALIGSYNRHIPSALLYGCMSATVGRGPNGAIIRFHTAETSAMTWDSGAGRIHSGIVIANMQRTSYSPTQPTPVAVNMHLPGRIVVFTRTNSSTWSAESLQTPLDRPMMESFAFRPTGVKPFGESRISKTVMSISDDVMRTLENMAVSSAFYANPQKYLLGLSDEQYDEISKDKWSTAIGAMLLTTTDDNEDHPDFGQLSPASPQPYIEMLRTYATLFSAATGVPINSLGIVQDNPSSAQAIDASREDICIATEDLNESSSESLRNVALMAMAVNENVSISQLTEEQQSVMAHFRDPAMPSVVSQADAAVKIASADQGFAGTEVFYEMLGFDHATITRIMRDKNRSGAQSAINALKSAVNIQAVEGEGGDEQ